MAFFCIPNPFDFPIFPQVGNFPLCGVRVSRHRYPATATFSIVLVLCNPSRSPLPLVFVVRLSFPPDSSKDSFFCLFSLFFWTEETPFLITGSSLWYCNLSPFFCCARFPRPLRKMVLRRRTFLLFFSPTSVGLIRWGLGRIFAGGF